MALPRIEANTHGPRGSHRPRNEAAWQLRYERLSPWDAAYAVDMAIGCLITYWIMTSVLSRFVGEHPSSVGVLWAVISTAFVYRDTRVHSLSAGITRMIATCVSFVLCLCYLLLFPFTPFGMTLLLVIGTLVVMSLGRREEIGLTAITTIVIMVVAAIQPHDAWHQPLLRFIDSVVGISVGVACKWIASFLFYRSIGEEAR